MKTFEEVGEIINGPRKELEEKYKVKTVAIFGSYARNEQTEDGDIMVEFSEPVGFEFFRLARFLEDILGVRVDLALRTA